MRKVAVAVMLAWVLVVPGAFAQNVLPPESSVLTYVKTLVAEYNDLVNASYPHGDPIALKAAFPLYEPEGDSFQVIVMQAAPNSPGHIALVFNPIHGTQYDIVMDNSDTLQGFAPHAIAYGNSSFVLTDVTIDFNGIPTLYVFAMGAPSDNMTVASAYSAAGEIFQSQASSANIPNAAQGPSSNELWIAGGVVVAVIVIIFGSLSGFFSFLLDVRNPRKRQKFLRRVSGIRRPRKKSDADHKERQG